MCDEAKYKRTLEKIMYELSLTELYEESVRELFGSGEILVMLDGRIGQDERYLHPLKVTTTFGFEKITEKNSAKLDLYEEWCEYIDGYYEEGKEIASLYVESLEQAIAGLKERYSL